jgi:hypothetical protein
MLLLFQTKQKKKRLAQEITFKLLSWCLWQFQPPDSNCGSNIVFDVTYLTNQILLYGLQVVTDYSTTTSMLSSPLRSKLHKWKGKRD